MVDLLTSLLYEFGNVDLLSALEIPRAWPEMSHNGRLLRDPLLLCQQRQRRDFPASYGFFLSRPLLCCTQPVQETACPAGLRWVLSMFGHAGPGGTGEVKGPRWAAQRLEAGWVTSGLCSMWALGRFELLPETNLCTAQSQVG